MLSGAANDVRTAQQRERRAIVDVQFRRAFGSRREQRVTCDANDFEQPARGSGQLFDARTDDLLERDGRRRHAGRHLEVMQHFQHERRIASRLAGDGLRVNRWEPRSIQENRRELQRLLEWQRMHLEVSRSGKRGAQHL